MSLLFTGLEAIRPPTPGRPVVLFYCLSIEHLAAVFVSHKGTQILPSELFFQSVSALRSFHLLTHTKEMKLQGLKQEYLQSFDFNQLKQPASYDFIWLLLPIVLYACNKSISIYLCVWFTNFLSTICWEDNHRSVEFLYYDSQAWKDCSHGSLLHQPVYWLLCLGISIGCLLCSLSYAPLKREVLVDSEVRGPTWLEMGWGWGWGGEGESWLLWLPAD